MKNIFIVNPAAGRKDKKNDFINSISQICKNKKNCEIYITNCIEDATNYVKTICSSTTEPIRFFACGGDGTLNEVINGAVNFNNAIIGCIPIGTGNDFVRNFDKNMDFLDIDSQLNGEIIKIDLIEYTGFFNEKKLSGYSANMFNIGFDCNVVDMTSKLKKWPLISGSFAYLLGVAIILFRKKGATLQISSEDDLIYNGPLLLTTIANGCYCGGGIKSNPLAQINDGFFDLQIISDMSRITFVSLFPKYVKGTHLATKKSKDLIIYKVLNNLTIKAKNNPMRASIDGEVYSFNKLQLKSGTKKISFSLPGLNSNR